MALFADEEMERAFARDGFVVFPLLSSPAVQGLLALWEKHAPTGLDGIYSNVQNGRGDANAEISEAIIATFREAGDRLFGDSRLPSATFLVKGTGPASDSKLHQDYNNVDEGNAQSATLWVPLVDVSDENGALRVLRGSHIWFPTARAVTLPSAYFSIDAEILGLTELVEMPAGHAIAYAHALFHGSSPNRSTTVRPAAVAGLIPADARHIHYWRPDGIDDELVEELHIDGAFYLSGLREMAAGRVPDGVKIGRRVARRHVPLSRQELISAARERS